MEAAPFRGPSGPLWRCLTCAAVVFAMLCHPALAQDRDPDFGSEFDFLSDDFPSSLDPGEDAGIPIGDSLDRPLPAALNIGTGINWRWTGRVRQRFEIDTNRGLLEESNGTVYGSRTSASSTVTLRSKQTRLSTTFGVTGVAFAGNEEAEELTRIDPRLGMNLRYDGRRFDLNVRGDASVDSTSFTQVDDTGVTEDETQQLTFNYDADLSLPIDRLNSLVLGLDGRIVRFQDASDNLTPSTSLRFSAGTVHRLNPVTSLRFVGSLRYFESNGTGTGAFLGTLAGMPGVFSNVPTEEQTKVLTYSLASTLTHRRTPRHRFGLTAGVNFVQREELLTAQPIPMAVIPAVSETDQSFGFTGGAGFDYRLGPFAAGIDISQRLEPSATGDLRNFTRLAGNIGYRVTERERISANISLSRRAGGSDDGQRLVLRLGPRYSFDLAPRTSLNLGYTLRISRDEGEQALGHRVFMSVARRFTIEP